jgi:hypothetical protein
MSNGRLLNRLKCTSGPVIHPVEILTTPHGGTYTCTNYQHVVSAGDVSAGLPSNTPTLNRPSGSTPRAMDAYSHIFGSILAVEGRFTMAVPPTSGGGDEAS